MVCDRLFQSAGAGMRSRVRRARTRSSIAARRSSSVRGCLFVIGARLRRPCPATDSTLFASDGDLAGGLVGGLGDLVGQARQALMQRLHRVLQAVLGGASAPAAPAARSAHDMRAELVEGLGLFAGGDVDFGRGLAHGAVVFGLAALGGIEPAADAAQLFLDAALGVRAISVSLRLTRASISSVSRRLAETGGRPRRASSRPSGCGCFARTRGRCTVAQVGKAAQNPARQPFADRQAFAPGSGARGFPRFGRDAGHVPGKLCAAFSNSPDTAPAKEGIGGKI